MRILMEGTVSRHHFSIKSQTIPPLSAPDISASSSPIVTVAVSITVIAFLLLGYCFVLTKCCPNQHRLHLMRHFSLLRARQDEEEEDSFIALSPTTWNQRGLDLSIVHEIPAFPFQSKAETKRESFCGCTVCLNEFQERDLLRVLPMCDHAFHSECIDMWLQSNSNCPLCRTSISGAAQCTNDHTLAPSSSPQDSQLYSDIGDEEDYVVIELRSDHEVVSSEQQEQINSKPLQSEHYRKNLEKDLSQFKSKRHRGLARADEDLDKRDQDQLFIQPIRRSFSLDSAKDRNLYLTIQDMVKCKKAQRASKMEECSSKVRS